MEDADNKREEKPAVARQEKPPLAEEDKHDPWRPDTFSFEQHTVGSRGTRRKDQS